MTDDADGRTEGPPWGALAALLLVLALPGWGIYRWVFCRFEVPPAHVAVLIAKTGEDLGEGEVAAALGQKGIQLETLPTGRHFRHPLFWDWQIVPIVNIPPGQIGVLTRLWGDTPDLTQDLLVPRDGRQKGIVAEILAPGLHEQVNPLLHTVEVHPAVVIEAGFVGVVCNRVGKNPADPNVYLVAPGERGVQREVLRPGTYYLNPYATTVYPIDVRAQRLELSVDPLPGQKGEPREAEDQRKGQGQKGRLALVFPSSDGFEIEVKLTVEWAIDEARAAEVFVRMRTDARDDSIMDEVLHKVLIPALRGNARIEGSKYPAANYIAGESRTVFQTSIFDALKAACEHNGISIRSVLVNDIVPPQDIARPIREREVAREELARNRTQQEQAKAEQSLARETELVQQEQKKVEAETEKEQRRIRAENEQRMALIAQEQALAVAQADLAAAELEARAILARGQAEADVIVAQNVAQAEALRASVEAFGAPSGFSSYLFARRLAPRIESIFADPDGPFGGLFHDLLMPAGAAPGGAR